MKVTDASRQNDVLQNRLQNMPVYTVGYGSRIVASFSSALKFLALQHESHLHDAI